MATEKPAVIRGPTDPVPDLLGALRRFALDRFPLLQVADVRVGLVYTAVRLEDGGTGVARTGAEGGRCADHDWPRPLAGSSSQCLIELLMSSDLAARAVGLACVNALANRPGLPLTAGDVLEGLLLNPTDTVAMVGKFEPLLSPLRRRVRCVHVFEQHSEPDVLPAENARHFLPGCNLALITSTALLNDTLGGLLRYTRHCRAVVLMGPSTPLLADFFWPLGVSRLAGIVVEQPDALLQAISEGGGTPHFLPFARKVVLELERVEVTTVGFDHEQILTESTRREPKVND